MNSNTISAMYNQSSFCIDPKDAGGIGRAVKRQRQKWVGNRMESGESQMQPINQNQ